MAVTKEKKKQAPARKPLFKGKLVLTQIGPKQAKYQIIPDPESKFDLDLAEIDIDRAGLPRDADFNLVFLAADVAAGPIDDKKTGKKAVEEMVKKQKAFRRFQRLTIVIR